MSDSIKYQSRDTQTSIEEVGGRILSQNYKKNSIDTNVLTNSNIVINFVVII